MIYIHKYVCLFILVGVYLFNKNNAFIQQECIKLFNGDSKDIYNVTKKSY